MNGHPSAAQRLSRLAFVFAAALLLTFGLWYANSLRKKDFARAFSGNELLEIESTEDLHLRGGFTLAANVQYVSTGQDREWGIVALPRFGEYGDGDPGPQRWSPRYERTDAVKSRTEE